MTTATLLPQNLYYYIIYDTIIIAFKCIHTTGWLLLRIFQGFTRIFKDVSRISWMFIEPQKYFPWIVKLTIPTYYHLLIFNIIRTKYSIKLWQSLIFYILKNKSSYGYTYECSAILSKCDATNDVMIILVGLIHTVDTVVYNYVSIHLQLIQKISRWVLLRI